MTTVRTSFTNKLTRSTLKNDMTTKERLRELGTSRCSLPFDIGGPLPNTSGNGHNTNSLIPESKTLMIRLGDLPNTTTEVQVKFYLETVVGLEVETLTLLPNPHSSVIGVFAAAFADSGVTIRAIRRFQNLRVEGKAIGFKVTVWEDLRTKSNTPLCQNLASIVPHDRDQSSCGAAKFNTTSWTTVLTPFSKLSLVSARDTEKEAVRGTTFKNKEDVTNLQATDMTVETTKTISDTHGPQHDPLPAGYVFAFGRNMSKPRRPVRDLSIMHMPNEVLFTILSHVELTSQNIRALKLTCRKFRNLLRTNYFRILHTGRHLNPGMKLYRTMANFTDVCGWVGILLHQQERTYKTWKDLSENAPYNKLNLISDIKKEAHQQICKDMHVLHFTAVAILDYIRSTAEFCLGTVTNESLKFVQRLISVTLPEPIIMLLRWEFYLLWLKVTREGFSDSLIPEGAEFEKTYGLVPAPNPRNLAPTTASLRRIFLPQLPAPATRRFQMLPCAFLFGPAKGAIHRLLQNGSDPLSGPFFWFLRDSSAQIALQTGGNRQLKDGQSINFYEFNRTVCRRFGRIRDNLGLEQPPIICPPDWDGYIEYKLASTSSKIKKLLKKVDFAALGRLIKDEAMMYTKRTVGVKRNLDGEVCAPVNNRLPRGY
ncbi:hypothetical protein LTS08_003355 [Lithohypha guttulata]|nr:hypothetical protein LTS08_003355 [Lithohypha guttulata]